MRKRNRAAFEGLRTVRREWESNIGCSEVCEAPDGTAWIRLRIRDPACQRDLLAGCGRTPARLLRGTLEALLPCRDGIPLGQWREECAPALGQLRDACLSVVAGCIGTPLPPCVIALSARTGNLRFSPKGAWLQLLPDWGGWSADLREADAVCAVAAVCRSLLSPPLSRFQRRHIPAEVRLLYQRADSRAYVDWGQLQGDLARLPDSWPALRDWARARIRLAYARTARFWKIGLCAAAAVLLLAAFLSLAGYCREWRSGQERLWPGMTPVGSQELGPE